MSVSTGNKVTEKIENINNIYNIDAGLYYDLKIPACLSQQFPHNVPSCETYTRK